MTDILETLRSPIPAEVWMGAGAKRGAIRMIWELLTQRQNAADEIERLRKERGDMKYAPQPDAETPSQADFIMRLASLPHTRDDGPATTLEMGGALHYLNDAIQVAREIVTRDALEPSPD